MSTPGEESARAAALAAGAARPRLPPAEVDFTSNGAVLVAGSAERALPAVIKLAETRGLRVVAVLEGSSTDARLRRRVSIVPGHVVGISGCLGRFSAQAAGPAGALDLGPMSPNPSGHFDVVVDFCDSPLAVNEVTPLGYFRPEQGPGRVEALASAIASLSGKTIKPQFVRFAQALCTHCVQSVTGCTRCLDACPAGAIASVAGQIALDTGLCRGCGSCTAVCPTGALSYNDPRPEGLRARLRDMLDAFMDAGGETPRLLIHGADEPSRAAAARDPGLLPLEVNTVASVGLDIWLSAIAMGAAEVMVLETEEIPLAARRLLAAEIKIGRTVLGALGIAPGRLRVITAQDTPVDVSEPAAALSAVSACRSFPVEGTKRVVIEQVIAALSEATGAATGIDRVPLPADAPFGEVHVDEAACTLCLACVGVCPTGALAGTATLDTLSFTESTCVQCGLCAAVCPEDAIVLSPSFAPDVSVRTAARVLQHADVAKCSQCGELFLPRVLLQASFSRIGGDVAENAESVRSLEVCPRCRSLSAMRQPFIDGAPGRDPSR